MASIGFEAGQHDDPASVDRAQAALWLALEGAGVLAPGLRPEVALAHRSLARARDPLPSFLEVRYRHAIEPADRYKMRPGFRSFQAVAAGDELGTDRRGPVRCDHPGLLLMPLYQGQGADAYFIVRPVRRVWLELSALMRKMRFERILHWFPGIERDPTIANAFLVDLRRARMFALELFHLLGFRRLDRTETTLRMARRSE